MNLKLNVLFLLHLPPPVHGSSIVGMNIKNSVVVNNAFDCFYINLLASSDVSETGKISFRKIFGTAIPIAKLVGNLVLNRPKVCYLALTSTGVALYRDFFLVLIVKLFRIKLVYHMHNKGVSVNKEKTINRVCYNYLFNNVEVIILSKRLYSDIECFVPESKVYICPNGIEDQNLKNKKERDQSQENASKQIVKILFLSNLIVTKGIFVLLEALAILKQKNILFTCILIGGEGDVTSTQLNEKIGTLGLKSQVIYQGKKFSEEKREAFLEADIFAFPTFNEAFGLVLLEAMSFCLPIVSTFEGAIPDIIENGVTGFLVPQKNVEALAASLELLIRDPELRQRMGNAGRKKYEQEFTIDIFENKLTEILHSVIKKGNSD